MRDLKWSATSPQHLCVHTKSIASRFHESMHRWGWMRIKRMFIQLLRRSRWKPPSFVTYGWCYEPKTRGRQMFRRLGDFHNKYKAEMVVISSMVYNCFRSTKEVNEFNDSGGGCSWWWPGIPHIPSWSSPARQWRKKRRFLWVYLTLCCYKIMVSVIDASPCCRTGTRNHPADWRLVQINETVWGRIRNWEPDVSLN